MSRIDKYLGEGKKKKPGTKVKVPHKGKMVSGKIVRYDKGDPHGTPYYVVDVGEYASIKVPIHNIKEYTMVADVPSAQLKHAQHTIKETLFKIKNQLKMVKGKARFKKEPGIEEVIKKLERWVKTLEGMK